MNAEPRRVGLIGAGKLGTTLGRLLVAAGYGVTMASRQRPDTLQLMLDVLVPGARAAADAKEVVADSDLVVLALPLSRLEGLSGVLGDRLVVDATNYWRAVDGELPAFADRSTSSSEVVAGILRTSRLVKGFSHLGYHDLDQSARRPGDPERRGLAVAADDADDAATVAAIVDRVGFDPVVLSSLRTGAALEAGGPAFGALLSARELQDLLETPSLPHLPTNRPERTGCDSIAS